MAHCIASVKLIHPLLIYIPFCKCLKNQKRKKKKIIKQILRVSKLGKIADRSTYVNVPVNIYCDKQGLFQLRSSLIMEPLAMKNSTNVYKDTRGEKLLFRYNTH